MSLMEISPVQREDILLELEEDIKNVFATAKNQEILQEDLGYTLADLLGIHVDDLCLTLG